MTLCTLVDKTLRACLSAQEPVVPLCFLRAKPIGVMQMIDQGEQVRADFASLSRENWMAAEAQGLRTCVARQKFV